MTLLSFEVMFFSMLGLTMIGLLYYGDYTIYKIILYYGPKGIYNMFKLDLKPSKKVFLNIFLQKNWI